MDNKNKPDTETSSGPSVLEVMSPSEKKVQFERLKRTVRVTKTLIHAVKNYKNLLHKFSAPFLEPVSEQDSQKKISARKNRQRDAVFLTAKDVLASDHPARKSVEKSLHSLDGLDASIISNAQAIKEKIVEKLDALINRTLKEAEEQPSKESAEYFAQTVQDLNSEMDLRLGETTQLHKNFKAELRQAWIRRLITGKNLTIAAAILLVDTIGTIGYMTMTQEKAPAPDIAAPPAIQKEIKAKKVTSIPSDKVSESPKSESPKTISASANGMSRQNKISDPAPVASSSQNKPSDIKAVNGGVTLSSGQDPETMKKNMHALGDAIRAWNAENAAQDSAAKEKGK
ncbi:MAG TPA: hypothetical protein VIF82_02115 [Burkholderiaceae bacterium]|jgi:hypothetical protein